MDVITEASAMVHAQQKEIVDRTMPVFYNPVMKLNRDVSIILIRALGRQLRIADPLAGSGIRSIRIQTETDPSHSNELHVNDIKPGFKRYLESNLRLNSKKPMKNMFIYNMDANVFLSSSKGFDYIDIDPFGSPNPFLDAGIQALRNEGILAVTATDTAPLSGTYPLACKRKYNAIPLRNEQMHEYGIRILIRKVQLVGAQYDKALIPILSYAKDHYFRIFFKCKRSKNETDKVLKQHRPIIYNRKEYGPFWTGRLFDSRLLIRMKRFAADDHNNYYGKQTQRFIDMLGEESKADMLGFIDVHKAARKFKNKSIPRIDMVIESLRKKGFKAERTHFSPTAIKTDANTEEFERIYETLV